MRFTRDVDIAVVVADDSEAESLTYASFAREQDLEAKLAVVLHDVGYLKR